MKTIKGYLGYVKTKAGKKYYSPDTGGRYFKTPQAAVKSMNERIQRNINGGVYILYKKVK